MYMFALLGTPTVIHIPFLILVNVQETLKLQPYCLSLVRIKELLSVHTYVIVKRVKGITVKLVPVNSLVRCVNSDRSHTNHTLASSSQICDHRAARDSVYTF